MVKIIQIWVNLKFKMNILVKVNKLKFGINAQNFIMKRLTFILKNLLKYRNKQLVNMKPNYGFYKEDIDYLLVALKEFVLLKILQLELILLINLCINKLYKHKL